MLAINLVTFIVCGFYARWWRYVSTRDMWGVARGVTIGSLLTYLVLYAFPPEHTSRLPHRVAAIDFLLLLALVAGSRLLARTLLERPQAGLVAHGKEVLDRGRRQRGAAARPRDPAQPRARLHADRLRRRRPEEEEASRSSASACSARPTSSCGSCTRTGPTRC